MIPIETALKRLADYSDRSWVAEQIPRLKELIKEASDIAANLEQYGKTSTDMYTMTVIIEIADLLIAANRKAEEL